MNLDYASTADYQWKIFSYQPGVASGYRIRRVRTIFRKMCIYLTAKESEFCKYSSEICTRFNAAMCTIKIWEAGGDIEALTVQINSSLSGTRFNRHFCSPVADSRFKQN